MDDRRASYRIVELKLSAARHFARRTSTCWSAAATRTRLSTVISSEPTDSAAQTGSARWGAVD